MESVYVGGFLMAAFLLVKSSKRSFRYRVGRYFRRRNRIYARVEAEKARSASLASLKNDQAETREEASQAVHKTKFNINGGRGPNVNVEVVGRGIQEKNSNIKEKILALLLINRGWASRGELKEVFQDEVPPRKLTEYLMELSQTGRISYVGNPKITRGEQEGYWQLQS